MTYLKGIDNTAIRVDTTLNNDNNKVCYLFSGFGYTTNHPLLYYEKRLAWQCGFSTICFDFDYVYNEVFLSLNEKQQDEYFERDLLMIHDYLKECKIEERLFIGKSMGTTVINRLMQKEIIKNNDRIILLTPGIEWNRIIENLKKYRIQSLVIGSLCDKSYKIEELKEIYSIENIEIFEFDYANHLLESSNIDNDINAIAKIIQKSKEFINKNNA